MPRPIDATLRTMLERSNPITEHCVLVSAPDVADVLRDFETEFSHTPSPLLTETPASTIASTPSGGLTLNQTSPSGAVLAQRTGNNTEVAINPPAPSTIVGPGLAWTPGDGFTEALLRSFTATIRRKYVTGSVTHSATDFELQIYLAYATVGQNITNTSSATIAGAALRWSFQPLLSVPAVWKYDAAAWALAGTGGGFTFDDAALTFDLTQYNLTARPIVVPPASALYTKRPYYLFVVTPVRSSALDAYLWRIDNTASTSTTGIGTFKRGKWVKNADPSAASDWTETIDNDAPMFVLSVDDYVATSQLVYALDMGAVPSAASEGRAVLGGELPSGTSWTLEVSTAGSGGPWTAIVNAAVISTKQQTYHLRLTLNRSSDHRRAPIVSAAGIEFRTPYDVTLLAITEHMGHEINVPFLEGVIGEGGLRVVRFGRRDYADVASKLGSEYPAPRLEADIYLMARHPSITRANWLHMDRAIVTNRTPSDTSEQFGLISPLKQLKKKIPDRREVLNSVHTVQSGTTSAQVKVLPTLPGIGGSPTGTEYDGKNYYMRVRSSTQLGVETNRTRVITGNTGNDRLDFSPVLDGTLIPGDIVEVHSGTFLQPVLEWTDADPADVWDDIMDHLQIPPDAIGLGGLGAVGRSGRPPTLALRFPGDTAAQDRHRVTFRSTSAETADKLIDQLSFHMDGATVEIGGQIVFRPIYPTYDEKGVVIIPSESPAHVFTALDTIGLQTPSGVEQRLTVVTCTYGVDPSLSNVQQATQAVRQVDGDALAWLDAQDVEGLGMTDIPSDLARWCYNSFDQGFTLAKDAAGRIIRGCSTGIRVWSWRSTDQHPELCVGDVVTMITDAYTDFDPSRQAIIRGTWAYTLVLVYVGDGGRSFRGFMRGLSSAVAINGGTGTITAHPLALTLDVTSTETSTTYDFAYTSTGTVQYRVDAGSWTNAGASPVSIARNAVGGLAKQVQFRATLAGGQSTYVGPFNVPPQVSSPPARSFSGISDSGISYDSDTQSVDWFVTGVVAGDYFDLERQTTDNGVLTQAWTSKSGNTVATSFTDPLGDEGYDLQSTGTTLMLEYRVKWYDSGNTLQLTSSTLTINTHHA